ncbi:MAG: mechanosensitive ion channel family protein [Ignavibacteriales bacterium]|nr:mechanosensitive ion channel family protein [Ignavibacteriales bacterium]
MLDSFFDQVLKLFGGNRLPYHAVLGLAVGIATLFAGKLFKFLLNTVGRKVISKTTNKIDDRILDILLERIVALSGILGLYLGMKELRLGLRTTNDGILSFIDYSNIVLYIITAILLTTIVVKITRTIITETVRRTARRNNEDELGQTLPLLLNRVATFVIIAVAAIVVLDKFGQNISSILTILGAGSLALGLAAQDTISNMISGFVIMIDRPFRVGDRVKIPTGEIGDVYEIGLRSTKILDFDNNLLIVPNNDLVKTRIVNYGYPHGEIRVVVEVSVAYGSDIEKVKHIMLSAASANAHVLRTPAPEAYLMKLADSSMNFSLFCRVPDFKVQFVTAEALRIAIYNELVKAKIEIPFPQQVVHHKFETKNALRTSRTRKKISR